MSSAADLGWGRELGFKVFTETLFENTHALHFMMWTGGRYF